MGKTIFVGAVHLASWKLGDKLYNSRMLEYPNDYKEEINFNPKEIVLFKGKKYTFDFSYPLTDHFIEQFELTHDIVCEELIKMIVDRYHAIYEFEEVTSKDKPGHLAGMYNRNKTSGKYGIWGHDLGDLTLIQIDIDRKNVITVMINS